MMDTNNVDEESQTSSLPDQFPIEESSASSEPQEVELPRIRCPKIKSKMSKQLQSILHAKISSKKKYFSAGHGITPETAKDVSKFRCPYTYPKDLETLAYKIRNKAWRDDIRLKQLKEKCALKPSYNARQKMDLLPRLYVEEPPAMNMKTILDVDPEYYQIVEGRPIPDNLDIRTYITTVRETLRTKIMIGYREDDIMLIEENLNLEQRMIERIKENLQTYIDTFEEFLYRDHTSAMNLLKESDANARIVYDKYEEYKKLEKKFGALRSSLYNSEEKWRNCKMYQKFLFVVSPLEWRHTRVFRRASIYMTEDEEDDDNVFGKYRSSTAGQEASLTDILNVFREETQNENAPEIFFQEAQQLMDVFRFMEMQNLNSLLHCEELAVPLDIVRDGMRLAGDLFDREIHKLRETIDRLEGGISWEEERAKYLEQLAEELIGKEFKNIVTNEEVLNIHVFVEDVYETRVGPNDANLNVTDMMKGIEEKYRNELLEMDKVPAEQVRWLEGSCYEEQIKIMKLAETAARQHAEMQSVIHSLNRAFAPPFRKSQQKPLKERSPIYAKKKQPPPPPRALTVEETEYLEFFTDFCAHTDDPKDYGINTNKSSYKLSIVKEEPEKKGSQEEDEDDEEEKAEEPKKEPSVVVSEKSSDRLLAYRKKINN